jgi:hypothetical protein
MFQTENPFGFFLGLGCLFCCDSRTSGGLRHATRYSVKNPPTKKTGVIRTFANRSQVNEAGFSELPNEFGE